MRELFRLERLRRQAAIPLHGGAGGPSYGLVTLGVDGQAYLDTNLFPLPADSPTAGAGGDGGVSVGAGASGDPGLTGAFGHLLELTVCGAGGNCPAGTQCDANGVCVPNN